MTMDTYEPKGLRLRCSRNMVPGQVCQDIHNDLQSSLGNMPPGGTNGYLKVSERLILFSSVHDEMIDSMR